MSATIYRVKQMASLPKDFFQDKFAADGAVQGDSLFAYLREKDLLVEKIPEGCSEECIDSLGHYLTADNGKTAFTCHYDDDRDVAVILVLDTEDSGSQESSDVPEMTRLLFIRGEDVGRHDYTPDELCRYLRECVEIGRTEYMSIWERSFTDRRTLESYLEGLDDAGCSEDYAVFYWDPSADDSDSRGKTYTELCDILHEFL